MATRRSVLALAALIALALALSLLLRGAGAPGHFIDKPGLVAEVHDDPQAPQGGAANGDLTIAVFTDYRCSVCRAEEGALQRAAARDGRVRLVYKELAILGEPSVAAARAALAADRQGVYAKVREALMAAPRIDGAALAGAFAGAGGDWARAGGLVEQPDPALQAVLDRTAREALQLGLAGTPGYLAGPLLVRGGVGDERAFARFFAAARAARRDGRR